MRVRRTKERELGIDMNLKPKHRKLLHITNARGTKTRGNHTQTKHGINFVRGIIKSST
jgi:hypothetical protein